MRTITLEEHFVTQDLLNTTGRYLGDIAQPEELQAQLLDLGPIRLAAMDEAGIDLQILSLAAIGFDALPPDTATSLAHDSNDELAAAIRANPTRFAGFASLGLKQPEKAADELTRCVSQLGFKGAMLDGTTDGLFLDDPRFTPVFEAAVALDVPIYLHPAPPPESVQKAYFSGLPGQLGQLLSIAGWGWHAETGLHLLRLIVSGMFERLPKLQVIVGHMGEGVPYALARSSGILSPAAKLPHTVAEYLKRNVSITTSGYFTAEPFRCAREVVGLDRLMFSVDYPFSPNTRGRSFLTAIAQEMSEDEMQQLTHGNAERLFRV